MKRYLFLPLFLIFSVSISQITKNEFGTNILPEKDDWSIGMSADPFFNFLSDVLTGNNSSLNAPSFGDDLFFYIKKFNSNKRAVRYTFGANFDTHLETWSMGLGYGIENRRGSTRLQGMWGYNGFIGIGEKFDSSDWLSIPTLTYEDGYNMHIMTSFFIGCEYFFLPKIAIGAEYHYGATMHVTDNKTSFIIGNNSNNTVIKINYYF
ncbi:MAG: hypothetical protein CBD51_004530 [Flavobacteriales bacterium TMED191]|nr:MAG: hypothetical protein CBD51_004530 [Flavobacteriales bacterium TMED191]|tara:strand:- start:1180 stop:1800 length:621 start_codon:yes stop_codon:yes gene_type:complete